MQESNPKNQHCKPSNLTTYKLSPVTKLRDKRGAPSLRLGKPGNRRNKRPGFGTFPGTSDDQVKYYKNAAEKGDAKAQFKLGIAYSNGDCGVEQSNESAREWWKKAAAQGHEGAIKSLKILDKENKESCTFCQGPHNVDDCPVRKREREVITAVAMKKGKGGAKRKRKKTKRKRRKTRRKSKKKRTKKSKKKRRRK